MSEVDQAVGDIVQGTLTAVAIEHEIAAGPGVDGHGVDGHGGGRCLNCGTVLNGPFCAQCGQSAQVHKSLHGLGHDLLHGMLHFEGRIWRTLPMLAWQPGQLTRRYIDGQRARYVSPIALFLFAVFLTFAAINFGSGGSEPLAAAPDAATARSKLDAEIGGLEAQRKAAAAQHQSGEDLNEIDSKIAALKSTRSAIDGTAGEDKPGELEIHGLPIDATWRVRIKQAFAHLRANPELAAARLEENAHKYSWLLIPLSVPFVWMLFPFSRRFGLYDHAVFVTYSLCFMMMLQVAMFAASAAGLAWLVALGVLYMPFHLHRQLRGTYALSRWGAAWRTVLLMGFGAVVLTLWALGLMVLLLAE